jgi:predicted nucleotidyltransferase
MSLCAASRTNNFGFAGQLAQQPGIRYSAYFGVFARQNKTGTSDTDRMCLFYVIEIIPKKNQLLQKYTFIFCP